MYTVLRCDAFGWCENFDFGFGGIGYLGKIFSRGLRKGAFLKWLKLVSKWIETTQGGTELTQSVVETHQDGMIFFGGLRRTAEKWSAQISAVN